MSTSYNRAGFALLIALFAIAIVTALLLATTLRTSQETTVVHAETLDRRALADAETALWQGMAAISPSALQTEPIGTTTASKATNSDMTTQLWTTRTDTTSVWITADAKVRQGVAWAQHRIGLSATLVTTPAGVVLRPIPGHAWVDLL